MAALTNPPDPLDETQALQWLERELAPYGLQMRGHFRVGPEDGVLAPSHTANGLMVLVGNVGSEFWPHFAGSPEIQDGQVHPLDRWSQRIGDTLAARCGGSAFYPFGGPPYHPFQQWASKAENLAASPLGLRIHPVYGLWHAYRFALVMPVTMGPPSVPSVHIDSPPTGGDIRANSGSMCESCINQPCLNACPVGAFDAAGYNVSACASHLQVSQQGLAESSCMTHSCLARLACPIGVQFQYNQAHGQFHMTQFALAHSEGK